MLAFDVLNIARMLAFWIFSCSFGASKRRNADHINAKEACWELDSLEGP